MPPTTKTALKGLSEAEMKLLCSLPGIESSVLEVIKTLANLASESADREARFNKRIDELSRQVSGLTEEVVSLKEAAIAKASVPPKFQAAQQSQRTRAKSSRNRTRTHPGQAAGCTSSSSSSTGEPRSVGDTGGDPEAQSDEDMQHDVTSLELEEYGEEFQPLDVISDDSWQLVSSEPPRPKKSVLYVGNLSESCTDDDIKAFTLKRSGTAGTPATVHNCSIHKAENGKISARITVDATAIALITSPNFWPRPLYARPWKFKQRSVEPDRDDLPRSPGVNTEQSGLAE